MTIYLFQFHYHIKKNEQGTKNTYEIKKAHDKKECAHDYWEYNQ